MFPHLPCSKGIRISVCFVHLNVLLLNFDSGHSEANRNHDGQKSYGQRGHKGYSQCPHEQTNRIRVGSPKLLADGHVGSFNPLKALWIDEAGNGGNPRWSDHSLDVLGSPVDGPDEPPRFFPAYVDPLGLVRVWYGGNGISDLDQVGIRCALLVEGL